MKGWTKSNLRQLCDDLISQKQQSKKSAAPNATGNKEANPAIPTPSPPALRSNTPPQKSPPLPEKDKNSSVAGNAAGDDYYGQGAKPKVPKAKDSGKKISKFKCELCKVTCKSEADLSEHVKNHDKHECELCVHVVFDNVDDLWKHVENVHYACNYKNCDYYFGTANGLKYHCQRVHKADPYFPCKHCGKIYRTRPTMVRHEAKCDGEIVYRNKIDDKDGSNDAKHPTRAEKVPIKTEPIETPDFGNDDDDGTTASVHCAFCERELINEEEKSSHETVCVANPNRLVVCKLCKEVIHGVVPLKQHLVKKHKQGPHLCKYCHNGFNWAKLRDEHLVLCENGPTQKDSTVRTRSKKK